METRRLLYFLLAFCILFFRASQLTAEQIPVRHVEGVTLGFLVVRNLDGQAIAYGDLKQVVKGEGGPVIADMQLNFKDGSFYQEITKFTQHGKFRLLSDQVVQKGPAFKQESESWIDAGTGKVTVRTVEKGKEKLTNKHLDLPEDVSNGLIFTLVKNVDPSAPETTVSMVAPSTSPRMVKLNILPEQEKTIEVGFIKHKAQHYVVKVKIEGVAGVIAPLVGKQPSDMHIWIVKSEAPTFIEFEGQLSQDAAVWRIEVTAPEPDPRKPKVKIK
ncbi:MAG: hypothetical protein JWO20_134 [Candidatus Angelobacter sp.]|jgi:hypothetical protein|nr:hypothetical protein [Candidatus Angelobacter sp.]